MKMTRSSKDGNIFSEHSNQTISTNSEILNVDKPQPLVVYIIEPQPTMSLFS
jgi:hypothetical protein